MEATFRPASSGRATPTLVALAAATMAFVLAQTTVIPALPGIQAEFETSADWVAWMFTAYLLVACVATPIFGRLGDVFGRHRLLAISLACFSVGSLVCAVAPSLELLVVGRALQGLGGGVFPLSFGVVREQLPARAVPGGVALLGSLATVGGGIGLPYGGLLVDALGYRSIFWVGAAMGVASTVAIVAFVPRAPAATRSRVDIGGALMLAAGLAVMMLGVSRSTAWGWTSPATVGLVAVGLSVLVAFWVHERHQVTPLLNVRTLARRPVLLTNVATACAGAGMVGAFVLVPQLGQLSTDGGAGLGLSATEAGLLLLPGSALTVLATPLVGRACARVGGRIPLLVGCLTAAAALGGMAVARDSVALVVIWAGLMSVGLGCALAAIPNLIVASVTPSETGEATGTNTVVRNVGMAVGAQVAGSVLASHALADGQLTARGFTVAFAIAALGGGLGAVAAASLARAPRAFTS